MSFGNAGITTVKITITSSKLSIAYHILEKAMTIEINPRQAGMNMLKSISNMQKNAIIYGFKQANLVKVLLLLRKDALDSNSIMP